ncbi:MAG: hypothetical protein EOO91_02100 [Pedobacter sp.]|nr:MAG: hypothetical protein EOO91_02100 [Pedobacter sp.]
MKKINLLSKAEMKKVMGGVADIGTPGGNNGNPCANGGCEAAGGTLTAQYASGTVLLGNCNEYPSGSECHNACFTQTGENFWC